MKETALERFWDILGQILQLSPEAFKIINSISGDTTVAVIIVLAAGFSQSLAQGIVLFVNRVKPLRFVLSLLIGAVLFTFGYGFLVLSTWAITLTPWINRADFATVAKVLGFSYAPLIFSIIGAMPYFGVPILFLLSIWHLLEMVVGFRSVWNISLWESFSYVALGWFTLQVLQQTIGQPIAKLGRWITNKAAGVKLVKTFDALQDILDEDGNATFIPMQGATPPKKLLMEESSEPLESNYYRYQKKRQRAKLLNRQSWQILSFLGLVFVTLILMLILSPLKDFIFAWHSNLGPLQFVFDLAWIGIIAFIAAGVLAPVEALGWWAGWYGDEVEREENPGVLAEPFPSDGRVSRYLVYLDGIGQSNHQYMPEIEEFLAVLAEALPDDIVIIKGIMPYSVLNKPLTEDRPLAFFWRLADRLRLKNPASLIGAIVNIRNIFIVAVSADQRYGPIYNRGTAQLVYNGLIHFGYKPNSGRPVTLVGYSGGGQLSMGIAPFLKSALQAPIEVISLGGVISGNVNALRVEHLYHLVGEKDTVERLGPILFAKRWPIYFLSFWNRAKRRGKISIISLGPVGHQLPGGMMDQEQFLPDGRSYLQQTVDVVCDILLGKLTEEVEENIVKPSNYDLFWGSPYNRTGTYPLIQKPPSGLYQPISTWMGRLILPKRNQRFAVRGVWFEVYHADEQNEDLVGKVVYLRWDKHPEVQAYLAAVTKDLHFSDDADYSRKQGLVVPYRLNHWRLVNPLESLAGARPHDDMVVVLREPLKVERNEGHNRVPACIYINHEPVQITGRFYALVKFIQPLDNHNPPENFKVVHFNKNSGAFDGDEEVVKLPAVVPDQNEIFLSTTLGLERSPLNDGGWYIYGSFVDDGTFIVQSLAPRNLLKLEPEKTIFGKKEAKEYLKQECWANITEKKGTISSVLLDCRGEQENEKYWQEGDRALLIHTYGGIGGNKAEPATKSFLYFGHFAYGVAVVIVEPLTGELRFDISYYQVYTHNTDGLIAGNLHWSKYMGDRQWGWLGVRPTSDILVKLEALTGFYDINGVKASALNMVIRQLEAMTARYRIGDGTGITYVGAANNCSQDSNQALYISIRELQQTIQANREVVDQWLSNEPWQAERFRQLIEVGNELKLLMLPFGNPRSDWENNRYTLGISLEDNPLRNLFTGLGSWRTMFPRLASDKIVGIFLDEPSLVWVLRTNQVGGNDPDIEPVAPTLFG